MEVAIFNLLPRGGVSPDRPLLLTLLYSYAREAVSVARAAGAIVPSANECGMALPWLERPVFVCGHHRSGTTLLQELLDGHPELRVLPSEGTYLTSFLDVARRDPTPQAIDRFATEWIARLVDPNEEPHFKLGRRAPGGDPYVLFARRLFGWRLALLHAFPDHSPFVLLLALIAALTDPASRGATPHQWVEKTPLNERHTSRLATFAKARFIHVVRDPAATLASLLSLRRKAGLPEGDRAVLAWGIGRSLSLATQNARRFTGRYLVVRYEDLAGDPASEMERVRSFLGLSPHPSLTTPTVFGHPVRSNSSFERGTAGIVRSPRPAPVLSLSETEFVSAFAGAPARAFGYDVAVLSSIRRTAILMRAGLRFALSRIRARVRGGRR
jgi:hypothetical protein